MSLPPKKGKEAALKRQLIHDLQIFLWRFEQGSYSQEAMNEVLSSLEKPLESHAQEIGGEIEEHVNRMIASCRFYIEGTGRPHDVVRSLDQLRQDLEK